MGMLKVFNMEIKVHVAFWTQNMNWPRTLAGCN
jgi:hypothetical protein